MWEKMTGSTTGTILECKDHKPNAMVKGTLMSRKEKAVKIVSIKKREHMKCCIKSCGSYVHVVCKDTMFSYKHAKPEHKKKSVLIVIRTLPKLVVGYAEVVLVEY